MEISVCFRLASLISLEHTSSVQHSPQSSSNLRCKTGSGNEFAVAHIQCGEKLIRTFLLGLQIHPLIPHQIWVIPFYWPMLIVVFFKHYFTLTSIICVVFVIEIVHNWIISKIKYSNGHLMYVHLKLILNCQLVSFNRESKNVGRNAPRHDKWDNSKSREACKGESFHCWERISRLQQNMWPDSAGESAANLMTCLTLDHLCQWSYCGVKS